MRWHHFGDHGSSWGGHFWIGPIIMIVLVALAIWLIVVLTRRGDHHHHDQWRQAGEHWRHAGPPPPMGRPLGAEQLLADRLARGEIEVADYNARIDALRSKPPTP